MESVEHLNKLRRLKYGNVSNTRKETAPVSTAAILNFCVFVGTSNLGSLILHDIYGDVAELVLWGEKMFRPNKVTK